ncbi:MAG TPA: serine hydrolase [Vicinamibacterales bacterium]|nr:serine hydrolase [Vicinamibacterales bacterium]
MHFGAFQVRVAVALLVSALVSVPAESFFAASAAQGRPTRPAIPASQQTTTTKKPAAQTPVAKKPAPKRTYSASASRARQARIAKARAEARAREAREAQTPRFRINDLGQEVPDVRAEAAIIYNPETNEVLWESNAQDQRSIASITKVMTALVFFESGTPLSTKVTVQRSDVYRASTTYLRAGYQVTADDLVNLLLIGSDNAAARVLARTSPYGAAGFVERMNEKAAELGLESTRYADPSGLMASNLSSAYDMARLIAFSAADERIGTIMRKASHTVYAGKRAINVNSTNHLVRSGEYDVLGGKTGFISRSGYCLATLLRLPQTGQQVAVVVLGAKSNQSRFWETRHLFNWMSTQTRSLFSLAQQQEQEN